MIQTTFGVDVDELGPPPRPAPTYWIGVQLSVDASRVALPELAYTWIRTLAERMAAPALAELAGRPARAMEPEPGYHGSIRTSRSKNGGYPTSTEHAFSDRGAQWLRTELDDLPLSVEAQITEFDDAMVGTGLLTALVQKPAHAPEWLLLQSEVPAARFADPAVQQQWLDALFAFADRVNPGYGHISYLYQELRTGLEAFTHAADLPRDEIEPAWTTGKSRLRLRGYSWVTILAQELADRLGGVPALTGTGAFAEVKQLAEGGVWLRATENFADYGQSEAEAVFRALAPVLRPGAPRAAKARNQPPTYLVFEDPLKADG